MAKGKQTAFAPYREDYGGIFDMACTRLTAQGARAAAGTAWMDAAKKPTQAAGWEFAKSRGWRIRKVVVSLADQEQQP